LPSLSVSKLAENLSQASALVTFLKTVESYLANNSSFVALPLGAILFQTALTAANLFPYKSPLKALIKSE